MPPDIQVSLARPSDLRHLAAIEDSGAPLFRDHFGDAAVPALLSPAVSGAHRDQEPGFLLVAREVGAPVGFAHVLEIDDRGTHAHLEQLSVEAGHGRRGIGTALVRAAMAEARWAGYDELTLCTYRDVPWNGPFYTALGFTEVTDLAPYQRDVRAAETALGLDDNGVRVVMSLSLRPARRR